jgi:transcriptional regulator with XRE-family HTH domain
MSSTHSPRYRRLLDRLQQARKAAGLTQVEVAAALGRPQSFVSKCESGERRIDVLELQRFASLYGRPLGYFVADGSDASGGASVAAEASARAHRRPSRRKGRRRPSLRRKKR